MFEKVVTAIEPFGLTFIVIAGLVLANRMVVVDRVMIGYVTVFIGVALILVHIIKQIKTSKTESKRKD